MPDAGCTAWWWLLLEYVAARGSIWVARSQTVDGRSVIAVKEIEHLKQNLGLYVFSDIEAFGDAQIHVDVSGSSLRISSVQLPLTIEAEPLSIEQAVSIEVRPARCRANAEMVAALRTE